MAEWYETFFDRLAFDVWRELVPSEMTEAEVAFLLRHLDPGGGKDGGRRLLDVPCGEGRLTRPLAAAGHQVVGVDLAAEAVARLSEEAASEAGVTALVGDMRTLGRALDGQAPFDGACCMGNSFGYLNGPDTAAFLEDLAAALRPGGRFVLDAATAAETVLPQITEGERYEHGDSALDTVQSYDPMTSTMIAHMTLESGGRRDRRVVPHRVMTCREIVESLEHAGFAVDALFGSTDDEPFVVGADRCLVLATRR